MAQPVGPKEWAADKPAPNKAEFVDWLEQQLQITDYPTQYALWQSILFSSAWLVRDERTRPSNKALLTRLETMENQIARLQSVLLANEKASSANDWTKYYLESAQIAAGAYGAIDQISNDLRALSALIERSKTLITKTQSGRRKDETLWDWVEALSMEIEIFTDIEIAVDFQKGEPITPYARLVYKAVQMLDSERLPQVESILKRYRTAHNKAQNSPN
ncbi:MAG: hypothetical protein AAF683_07765 [Pseudomonadota bacterium]